MVRSLVHTHGPSKGQEKTRNMRRPFPRQEQRRQTATHKTMAQPAHRYTYMHNTHAGRHARAHFHRLGPPRNFPTFHGTAGGSAVGQCLRKQHAQTDATTQSPHTMHTTHPTTHTDHVSTRQHSRPAPAENPADTPGAGRGQGYHYRQQIDLPRCQPTAPRNQRLPPCWRPLQPKTNGLPRRQAESRPIKTPSHFHAFGIPSSLLKRPRHTVLFSEISRDFASHPCRGPQAKCLGQGDRGARRGKNRCVNKNRHSFFFRRRHNGCMPCECHVKGGAEASDTQKRRT